jgi:methionyl-tRNA formyltransferase
MKIKLLFFSSSPISIPLFSTLLSDERFEVLGLFCQPDRPKGRKGVLTPPEPKKLALKHEAPVYQPLRLRDAGELLEKMKGLQPDFILTFAYGQILTQEWLDLPIKKALNVHASLLPKYRGASPIQAALLNGDEATGVSLMEMVLKMDYGPVAFMHELAISKGVTSSILFEELSAQAAQLIPDDLIAIYENDSFEFVEQKHEEASYCSKVTREDGFVDFSLSAEELMRRFRAYHPWPGLWTRFEGKRLKLIDVELGSALLMLGEVSLVEKQLHVGTSDGSLYLKQVQLEGKNSTYGASFALGSPEVLKSSLPSEAAGSV